MKQTQWTVALCALAALVFGITFAMNYLANPTGHRSIGPTPDPEPQGELTFAAKHAPLLRQDTGTDRLSPDDAARVLECEEKKPSYQDFWFRNDTDRPIRTGLDAKGCTCSSVGLAVLPDKARDQLLAGAIGWRGLGGRQGVLGLVVPMAATLQIVQAQTDPKELTTRVEHVDVPPHAFGFVRLGWTGKRAGRQGMEATLWMGEQERQPLGLSARVLFHEAMQVAPQMIDGLGLSDEDLTKGKEIELHVWSATRPHFRLRARLANPQGGKPESDPVRVGRPVALRGEELERLEALYTVPQGKGQVLSAYRVVVALRAVAADGTGFDLGRFRREVVISSPDEGISPISVNLRGRVHGLVRVGADNELLSFGQFRRGRGAKRDVTLFSSMPGVELKFDRTRTPKWLTAKLSKPTPGTGGRPSWTMMTEVLGGEGGPDGPFPSPERGPFHDAAIYLLATVPGGKPAVRTVRIEVYGSATGD
jgi:hypothetical protein